jgi:hypothetical protein
MSRVESTFKTVKNAFIVVGSILIPLLFVKILWLYIIMYWRLMFSILAAGTGVLFLVFYLKAYTPKTIYIKIKSYFSEKELIEEYIADEFGKSEVLKRSKNFLFIGIGLIVIAVYLINQYFLMNIKK